MRTHSLRIDGVRFYARADSAREAWTKIWRAFRIFVVTVSVTEGCDLTEWYEHYEGHVDVDHLFFEHERIAERVQLYLERFKHNCNEV